jgi:signal transduction histidine kinase
MTELRDIAKSLSSERLQLLSLPESIAQEIRRINRSGFIRITAQLEGRERNVPDQQKLIAFRMVQEGFQNIIKHAQASEVKVLIRYLEECLHISIFDNGNGFNPEEELKKREGLGLQNILRRAALVGGKAKISSKPGEGTTLEIQIAYA